VPVRSTPFQLLGVGRDAATSLMASSRDRHPRGHGLGLEVLVDREEQFDLLAQGSGKSSSFLR
jgi:hypothetical protein